jgi:hypothetical protein
MLHYSSMEMFASDKHFYLLRPFLSYKENWELQIQPLVPFSQQSIFFVTYEEAQ